MNREIKFRGLDENADFIYGNLFNNDFATRIIPFGAVIFDGEKISDHIVVDEATVGQFTGLKDKNGKEIYEGDIVCCKNWEPKNYVIEFIEGAFCLTNPKVSVPTDVTFLEDSTGKHFEIIGNVHQNPELLNA